MWHKATRAVEDSQISSLVLVFLDGSCLDSGILVFNCVVWCEFEFGINAHKSQPIFC